MNKKTRASECDHDNTVVRCFDGTGSEDREPAKMKWRELLHEFSRDTTLHGFRYITEADYFMARRLLWLLVTVVCWLLLTLHVLDRVRYYYSWPVTVNLQVNYNQSLSFPALTLCNQNAFRATSATKKGWYRVVEKMYGTNHHNLSWADTEHSDLTVDRLYVELGHTKEDFIRGCWWAGEPCSVDNFTTTLTDHGLCYTFNNISFTGRSVQARASGADHGLRLTLNTEQYEAMPGPHGTSGIKLLATDQSQFPRVNEVGIGIPSGTHAYVGLSVIVIKNLPYPYGHCGDQKLLTGSYTPDMCQLECVTNYVTERCGCRHFYMPDLNGDTPVCTISQYFDCYRSAFEYIHVHVMDHCTCPASCDYVIHETTISTASTSTHVHDGQLENLQARFFDARETTERMKLDIFQNFRNIVSEVTETFEQLKELLVSKIRNDIKTHQRILQDIKLNMTYTIRRKLFIYRYQEYSIQKNFMRARDAMEERTLSMVCLGFHEYVFESEYLLRELHEAHSKNSSNADTIYIVLKKMLKSKIETAGRAIANQTQLYMAYETGINIFDYKYKRVPRKFNSVVVPKFLLNSSLTHNSYARRYAPRVLRDIENVQKATREFEKLTDAIYRDPNAELNIVKMENISKNLIDECERYFHSKSTFYFEVVDRPLRIIQKRLQEFSNLKQAYESKAEALETNLQALEESLAKIEKGSIQHISDNLLMTHAYFNSSLAGNQVSKYKLANRFISKNISDYIHTLSLFMTGVRQRGVSIFGSWTDLQTISVNIWRIILQDKDSFEYYEARQIFLQNLTLLQKDVEDTYNAARDDNDLRLNHVNVDNEFAQSFTHLINHLQMYIDDSKMDAGFVRDNFLHLDIYFKELRHEVIEQQVAYDVMALLCDIGGSIGLFVGASTLTLFELLDFAINSTAVMVLARRRHIRTNRKSV